MVTTAERPGDTIRPEITGEIQATPESIIQAETRLQQVISIVLESPDLQDMIWEHTISAGAGDQSRKIKNLRLMSLPTEPDGQGGGQGESYAMINWVDLADGRRSIMFSQRDRSGNPWGDIITTNFSIVRDERRTDTAFIAPYYAETRQGKFRFGPAGLEAKQNAQQFGNPFLPATQTQIDRINWVLQNGAIHNQDGKGRVPRDEELTTVPIQSLLQQNPDRA